MQENNFQTQNQPSLDHSANRQALLERRFRSGVSWFYLIAALSLLNTILNLTGNSTVFIVGLGVTLLINILNNEYGLFSLPIVIGINVLICGIFALLGFLSTKQKWLMIIGMILYFLDSLIFVWAKDWLAAGFHLFVLIMLGFGFKAKLDLDKLKKEQPLQA